MYLVCCNQNLKHVTPDLVFFEMVDHFQIEINKKKIADRRDPLLQRVATGMKAKFDILG